MAIGRCLCFTGLSKCSVEVLQEKRNYKLQLITLLLRIKFI